MTEEVNPNPWFPMREQAEFVGDLSTHDPTKWIPVMLSSWTVTENVYGYCPKRVTYSHLAPKPRVKAWAEAIVYLSLSRRPSFVYAEVLILLAVLVMVSDTTQTRWGH